jgi:hypothetical protein
MKNEKPLVLRATPLLLYGTRATYATVRIFELLSALENKVEWQFIN